MHHYTTQYCYPVRIWLYVKRGMEWTREVDSWNELVKWLGYNLKIGNKLLIIRRGIEVHVHCTCISAQDIQNSLHISRKLL